MTDPRNARVMQLGWIMTELLARDVTAALEAINERLARADGYPTQTIGASAPAGEPRPVLSGLCESCERPRPCYIHDGASLTTVERAADQRYRYGLQREELRDRIEGLEIAVNSTLRYARMVLGTPLAEDVTQAVPMCRDNQVGKHAVDEWGDPLCPMTADKGGLCQRHYLAWWRARDRDGINVRGDHEPAA